MTNRKEERKVGIEFLVMNRIEELLVSRFDIFARALDQVLYNLEGALIHLTVRLEGRKSSTGILFRKSSGGARLEGKMNGADQLDELGVEVLSLE